MSEREQFEAWARKYGLSLEDWPSGTQYVHTGTQSAWKAWQASRVVALESAVKRGE